jgi:hypothetical protein
MKKKQGAKSKPRFTLREQYRQLAIKLLKKERTKILDIQTLRELIEIELGRFVKTDELIATFERRDDGLEVVTRETMIWVIYKATPSKKESDMPNPKKTAKKTTVKKPGGGKLSPADFTLEAIRKLRKPPYKGIHSVFSGFNAAFRKYFPDLDPVQAVVELAEKEIIISTRTRGGVLLYIPGEAPVPKEKAGKKARPAPKDPADEVLKKMGLA